MPDIRCGHCGGSHGSVAEIRECSAGGERTAGSAAGQTARADERDDAPPAVWDETFAEPAGEPSAPAPARAKLRDPGRLDPVAFGAGPGELGRNLVVRPGDTIPEAWADSWMYSIDPEVLASPEALVAELLPLWHARERFVIELVGDLSFDSNEATSIPSWELGPEFSFDVERLHHLVWSNSVEIRDGQLLSRVAARAVELGATLIDQPADAELRLGDGTEVVLDGGPLDPHVVSLPVVHAVTLSAGQLEPLGKSLPRAELADDQLAAVGHVGGAARIIAPAGSGKTRVLTERARHLVQNWGVPVDTLTLVAFNKRAQLEMLERTTDIPGLRVRTLNALALAILNGTDGFAPTKRRRNTISERDVRQTLDRLVEFPRRANTDPVAMWIEALTAARLGLRSPREVEASYQGDVEGFAEVFENYRQHLLETNTVDFDEQIFAAIEVLLTDPVARQQAQLAGQVLLVDEFQDLTPAHLLLVRLLAGPRADVFGVGDDDQTIYGFTGASPRWLIDYDRYFPGATSHALKVNYRCAPGVVGAASNLLSFNDERVEKDIRSSQGREPSAADLVVDAADDVVVALRSRVEELLDAGSSPSDIVVLSRVNVTLAMPQVVLAAAGIPVVGAVDTKLLDRTGIRAALAWLRVASDTGNISPRDIADTVRRPSRGMSRKVVEWMSEHRDLASHDRLANRLSGRDPDKVRGWISDAAGISRRLRNGATTAELLVHIRDQVGLSTALSTLDDSRGNADRSTHLDDLETLTRLAALQPNAREFERWLREQLDAPTSAEGAGVLLSTVHRVKGLEWPHVVVIGAEQSTFPHRLAEIEEERRVFHVAITRSSVSTAVIADKASPSQFLDEVEGRVSSVAAPERSGSATETTSRGSTKKKPALPGTDDIEFDESVFEALRSWRADRAKRDNVAPFIVFHDAVLKAVAATQPTNLAELSKVKGIGAAKLENYGDEVLGVLSS